MIDQCLPIKTKQRKTQHIRCHKFMMLWCFQKKFWHKEVKVVVEVLAKIYNSRVKSSLFILQNKQINFCTFVQKIFASRGPTLVLSTLKLCQISKKKTKEQSSNDRLEHSKFSCSHYFVQGSLIHSRFKRSFRDKSINQSIAVELGIQ